MANADELYAELDRVEHMDEEEVMRQYNADCKQDIIDLILEDLRRLEIPAEGEEEMDYDALCSVLSISRYG